MQRPLTRRKMGGLRMHLQQLGQVDALRAGVFGRRPKSRRRPGFGMSNANCGALDIGTSMVSDMALSLFMYLFHLTEQSEPNSSSRHVQS